MMKQFFAWVILCFVIISGEAMTGASAPWWIWVPVALWAIYIVSPLFVLPFGFTSRKARFTLHLEYPLKFDVTFRVKWKPAHTPILGGPSEKETVEELADDVRSYVVAWGVGESNWTKIYDQMAGLKTRLNKDSHERNAEVLDIRILNIENAPPTSTRSGNYIGDIIIGS